MAVLRRWVPWIALATLLSALGNLFFPVPALLLVVRTGMALLSVDFLLRLLTLPLSSYFRHGAGWIHSVAALPGLLLPLLAIPGMGYPFRWLPLLVLYRLIPWMEILARPRRLAIASPWVRRRLRSVGVALVTGTLVTVVSGHFLLRAYHLETVRESLDLHERLTGSFNLAVQLLPPADLVAWQQGTTYTRPLDDLLTPQEYLLLQGRGAFLTVALDERRSVILHDHRFIALEKRFVLMVLSLGALCLLGVSWGMGRTMYRHQAALLQMTAGLSSRNPDTLPRPHASLTRDEWDDLADQVREQLTAPSKRPPNPASPPSIDFDSRLAAFRKDLLRDLNAASAETAQTAVRLSSKSILEYLRKHGYGS